MCVYHFLGLGTVIDMFSSWGSVIDILGAGASGLEGYLPPFGGWGSLIPFLGWRVVSQLLGFGELLAPVGLGFLDLFLGLGVC